MLLLIDMGNTSINLCVHDHRSIVATQSISSKENVEREFNGFLNQLHYEIDDVVMASVVPQNNELISRSVKGAFHREPIMVSNRMKSNVELKLDNPSTVGTDRFVNAVAAHELYKNINLIVIDFGTATTYDFIRENGDFEFGLICPGIGICIDALHQRTAQLPKVELKVQDTIIAKNTYDSISAGNYFSKIGEIEYIINRIKKELGEPDIKVVATGGFSELMAQGTGLIHAVNPYLIFEGLRIIYHMFIGT